MKAPLTVYLYLDEIITSTDYIYAKLITEFLNSFYTTDNKLFKNQWGVVVDDFKLEFKTPLPSLVN